VSGSHITDQQVRLYMKNRTKKTQAAAAAMAGISERSASRIDNQQLQPWMFHYRLVASGWAYAQVVYGGESFSALTDGLQRAFKGSGGVPRQLRTGSLSAAYKNRQEQNGFTERFADLCRHYNLQPTRNNRGQAHENGAIESPNNHIKQQLKQALLLRGSFDFVLMAN
jgi:hypothetical protein